MSPQLLWTIAGLVLTVLTLGGVSISSYQSMDSATAKLVASEVGNVATASKLWLANDSTTADYTAITPTLMSKYIPDLAINAAKFDSKTVPAIKIDVAKVTATPSQVLITVSGMTTAQTPLVQSALTGKACTVANVSTTSVSYTCNG
jgi:hypothetical protein